MGTPNHCHLYDLSGWQNSESIGSELGILEFSVKAFDLTSFWLELRYMSNSTSLLCSYQTQWWEKFIPDLDRDLIESVCHQVLDIYSKPNSKKTAATPGKGATPAKKQKLGSFLDFS